MSDNSSFKYLVSSEKDVRWGITVDNVGSSIIPPEYDLYPPQVGHPDNYYFQTNNGRILDNYQLIYITEGRGRYYIDNHESIDLESGEMLIIPPYTWHSYHPDKKTGWHEYWIGLRGTDIDKRFSNGFFGTEKQVFKLGFRDEIIEYYKRAREIALQEKPGYQQVLAGLANMILAMTLYYDTNIHFTDHSNVKLIEQARAILRENFLTDITPKEVSERINMSYSWFRRMFKEYTNVSPARYLMELKLQKARNLLMNSELSIKHIAFSLNYEDSFYFSTIFKKYTGLSPSVFRARFSNINKNLDK